MGGARGDLLPPRWRGLTGESYSRAVTAEASPALAGIDPAPCAQARRSLGFPRAGGD